MNRFSFGPKELINTDFRTAFAKLYVIIFGAGMGKTALSKATVVSFLGIQAGARGCAGLFAGLFAGDRSPFFVAFFTLASNSHPLSALFNLYLYGSSILAYCLEKILRFVNPPYQMLCS